MSTSKALEVISSIIFLIAGIVTVTKYNLRARVNIYLNLFFTIGNFLWLLCCIITYQDWYVWVAILYVILGIIGFFNFRRIYRREKEDVGKYKM